MIGWGPSRLLGSGRRSATWAQHTNSTQWRIRLVPEGRRTTITQSFVVVRMPRLLEPVYAWLIPGHQDRDAQLAGDLTRIGPWWPDGVST